MMFLSILLNLPANLVPVVTIDAASVADPAGDPNLLALLVLHQNPNQSLNPTIV
jgi:hypothetical protein